MRRNGFTLIEFMILMAIITILTMIAIPNFVKFQCRMKGRNLGLNSKLDKAEAILKGEQVRAVAKLERQAAEEEKKKQILLGEGEATRKRLVMQADGALAQKLEALVAINAKYAEALVQAQPGALVPSIQMGSSGNGSSAMGLIDLLTAQAAKQLSTDIVVKKK